MIAALLLDARPWLKGLTLWPTQDGRWQASSTSDGQGWKVVIDADPAVALTKALGGAPPEAVLPAEDIFG